MLKSALEYLDKGFSVIPVRLDKKPYLVSWLEFQKRLPTKEEVTQWWTQWPSAGIAVITGRLSGLTMIDCDTYRVPGCNKTIEDNIELNPPAIQKTPRGGLHYVFKYTDQLNQTQKSNGIDIRNDGGYFLVAPTPGYEWEIPIGAAFLLPAVPEGTIKILAHQPAQQIILPQTNVIPEGQRDDTLFHLANRLFRGGAAEDEVRQHLMIFARACSPPFPEKEVTIKVESALKRNNIRTLPLSEDIRAWINSTNGYFTLYECEKALTLVNKNDKELIRQVMHQMVSNGILERHHSKNGCFRRLERTFRKLDLTKPRQEPFDLFWPFDLQKFYNCYSKNIVVLAGSPDVGKSAFCMNFALMNRDNFKVNYFSSEMEEDELQIRLSKFDIDFDEWFKINWVPLDTGYADAVRPDEINIFDFIEIHDEFWRVGGWINDIFRKLTTGMALIALQKPRSRDVAKGGEGTLEKPRLYLSMNPGVIKIIKCKNWATEQNPNGLSREFKIVQGCKFIMTSEWGIPWSGGD